MTSRPSIPAAALAVALLVTPLGARGEDGRREALRPRSASTADVTQEDEAAITYRWRNVRSQGAYGGSYRIERARGARATLRFAGSSVTWYTRKGPGQGKARIEVDGVTVRTVNNHSDQVVEQVARRVRNLGSGSHTVRIVVLHRRGAPGGGREVVVDAFRAGGEILPPSEVRFRWGVSHDDVARGGGFAHSSEPGARATFAFTGKGIDWDTIVEPDGGRARVRLDGDDRGIVDTYAAARARATGISVAGLADEQHTITVTVRGTKRPASGGTSVAVDRFVVRAPSIGAFRGLGAWIDLYDYPGGGLDAAASTADMASHGVGTLYIQTARYNSGRPFFDRAAVNEWVEAAHDAGMKVVGWYLPGYDQHLDADVRRTVAIADYESPTGERFDALAVDIEYKGQTESLEEFNDGIRAHLRRVRAGVGNRYPVGGIVPAPVAMALYPSSWTGFPWKKIGRYSDVVMPMAYWTYRLQSGQCPDHPLYCSYRYARANARRSHDFTGGLPVHVIGGVGDDPDITKHQVERFVDGTLDEGAVGGSFYDYATMDTEHPGYWDELTRLA